MIYIYIIFILNILFGQVITDNSFNSTRSISLAGATVSNPGKIESVFYGEPMPPDFLLSEQIVVIGSYNEESFIANEILLKCPSKYTENNIKL